MNRHRRIPLALCSAAALALVASCGSTTDGGSPNSGTQTSPADAQGGGTDDHSHHGHGSHDGHDHGDHAPEAAEADVTEQSSATPRLAVTYDGGVLVIEADTLDVVADLPAEGFTRLSPAGDDRHVVISESSAFRVIDLGTYTQPHGDHDHYYTTEPAFADLEIEAEEPGHVVPGHGRTLMWADGTGAVTSIDTDDFGQHNPRLTTWTADQPHHGVAVPLADGAFLATIGNPDTRSGVAAFNADGTVSKRYPQCPGVHGESEAADGAVVFGCENGAVVYSDGSFTPVQAPGSWTRLGNHAGDPDSPIVVTDFKVDQDAELERPRRIALVDSRDASLRLVDLPASYSFRSLERGPKGEALVQGTDGKLRIIDEDSGTILAAINTVKPWREPQEWQEPMPNLFAQGTFAYVTDPKTQQLIKVNLATRSVVGRATLPEVPNELSGVPG